jgi:hypothetical protein
MTRVLRRFRRAVRRRFAEPELAYVYVYAYEPQPQAEYPYEY